MTPTLVIPSLGGPTLARCLAAVRQLEPRPRRTVVVLSGAAAGGLPDWVEPIRSRHRLGFAAAVNAGLAATADDGADAALLNDDAIPTPDWLGRLSAALAADDGLAAVQGTVVDGDGSAVDGRGIAFDRWGLPIQVDRASSAAAEPAASRPLVAVSGTAALLRRAALDQVRLADGSVFDPAFGSYHEDVDLGLRLHRLGWQAAWIAGAPVRHVGSATGGRLAWRRPWWLLANRWRALAGNLTPGALITSLPRLARGELRAVATLSRADRRTLLVWPAVAAAWPVLIARGWHRATPGPRLAALPAVR